MKKAFRIIPLLTLIVPLAACGGTDSPSSSSSSSSESSSSSSSSESSSSSSEDTRAKELLAYNNTNEVTTVVPSEKKTYDGYYQKGTETHYTIEHVRESGGDSQLPSLGKQRILVCPIDFTNWPAKNTDTEGTGEVFRRRLFNAFFGDSDNEDVGFESVRSFYQTSSYGALQLEGVVLPWYHTGTTSDKVDKWNKVRNFDYKDYYNPAWTMVELVTKWAITCGIDLTEFDTNSDGYIDCIWMVYTCPSDHATNFWAYVHRDYDNVGQGNVESPVPFNFGWASRDFLNGSYDSGKYDLHTFIHETGHILGLDDYYSYDSENNESPTGGVDMMDLNVGDHNAYSKYVLGWVSPYVVDGTKDTTTITLKPFNTTGDCVLVRNTAEDPWNGGAYDEYILIQYDQPIGINGKDLTYSGRQITDTKCLTTYTVPGIRMWHVDSRLLGYNLSNNVAYGYTDELDYGQSGTQTTQQVVAPSNSSKYSRNEAGGANSPFVQLQLLCATGSNVLQNNTNYLKALGNDKFLFSTEDGFAKTFNMEKFSSFFVNNGKFDDGSDFPFEINLTSMTSEGATLTFTK